MASKSPPGEPIPFIDNPNAPETFATNATGFVNLGGAIGITLETVKVNHGKHAGAVTRMVVGRVIMPVAGAQALAAGLHNFLVENNIAPTERPHAPGSATASIQ